MINRNIAMLFLGLLVFWIPSLSYGVIYFQENFNQGDLPYSFGYYKFGYSDNPIQTFHDASGGVNNTGFLYIQLIPKRVLIK